MTCLLPDRRHLSRRDKIFGSARENFLRALRARDDSIHRFCGAKRLKRCRVCAASPGRATAWEVARRDATRARKQAKVTERFFHPFLGYFSGQMSRRVHVVSYHISLGEAFIAIYLRYGSAEKLGIYRKDYRDNLAQGKA